jgi:hypothetical protein
MRSEYSIKEGDLDKWMKGLKVENQLDLEETKKRKEWEGKKGGGRR